MSGGKKLIEELFCYDYFRRPVYGPKEDNGVSITEQSHKDACDINTIIKRYSDGDVAEAILKKEFYSDPVGKGAYKIKKIGDAGGEVTGFIRDLVRYGGRFRSGAKDAQKPDRDGIMNQLKP